MGRKKEPNFYKMVLNHHAFVLLLVKGKKRYAFRKGDNL
uniref:Uncharacterized protein n=2 Tax=unclassified Caudoviricetes TaxID=2788787 RepID=A0A8S5QKR5_9CAUD|nr:MAG TPA: hypothetical protein [Siphoviridae sp. ctVii20]DAE19395.1 MAG TPA: hypothetical protein [Siphoviridae sp. ctezl47]